MFIKKLTVFLLVIGLIFGRNCINSKPSYALYINNFNQNVITQDAEQLVNVNNPFTSELFINQNNSEKKEPTINTDSLELTYPNPKTNNSLGFLNLLEIGGLCLTGGIGLGWFFRHQTLLKGKNFNSLKERIENLETIVTKD